MLNRRLFPLVVLALTAGCAQRVPPPRVQAAPAALTPAPPTSLASRVRREGWMTRFWEQLTPAQRRRVLTRMRRETPPRAADAAEAATVWDSLGLPERDELIFGGGQASRRSG